MTFHFAALELTVESEGVGLGSAMGAAVTAAVARLSFLDEDLEDCVERDSSASWGVRETG